MIAGAVAGPIISAETKGELRERRRRDSRQRLRRRTGDDGEDGAGNRGRRETESVRTGGLELGRINPRKLSIKDRERFGGSDSRAASRSSEPVSIDLSSEPDGEEESGREGGNSSTSDRGLAALEPARDPVVDEHWEITIGESNKPSVLGTMVGTPSCSTLVMHSSTSAGDTLPCNALRAGLIV